MINGGKVSSCDNHVFDLWSGFMKWSYAQAMSFLHVFIQQKGLCGVSIKYFKDMWCHFLTLFVLHFHKKWSVSSHHMEVKQWPYAAYY